MFLVLLTITLFEITSYMYIFEIRALCGNLSHLFYSKDINLDIEAMNILFYE